MNHQLVFSAYALLGEQNQLQVQWNAEEALFDRSHRGRQRAHLYLLVRGLREWKKEGAAGGGSHRVRRTTQGSAAVPHYVHLCVPLLYYELQARLPEEVWDAR